MKVLYQWAKKNPTGWEQVDATQWSALPKKAVPKKGELGGQDNAPGWLANVSVQGIMAEGFDNVAVEQYLLAGEDGIRLTMWNDDPDDFPVGKRYAVVWLILPLAPDPQLGMAINTRQSCTWYCEGEMFTKLTGHAVQNTSVRPWGEFVAPPDSVTRHGVLVADSKWAELVASAPQGERGWMHWNEHLPDSECETDAKGFRVLKEQRKQGRYRKASHTITYYQRSNASAVGYIVSNQEKTAEKTTAASSTQAVTIGNNDSVECFTFTTASGEPNVADWPSGAWHCQLNVSAFGGTNYGLGGSVFNGFNRIASDTNSSLESVSPDTGGRNTLSGTGLKLCTVNSWDPTSGSTGDRLSINVTGSGNSHGQSITLTLNTSDCYIDGPWTTGTAWTQTLADTMTLADANIKTAAKGIAETMSMAENLGRAWASVKTNADTLVLADLIAKVMAHPAADTVTLADASAQQTGKSQTNADTMSLADASVKTVGLTKADSEALADALAKTLGVTKADVETMSDAERVTAVKAFLDTMSLADNKVETISKNLNDILGVADAVVMALIIAKTENMTITDAVAKVASHKLSDSLALTDSATEVILLAQTLADSLGVVDSVVKGLTRPISDSVGIAEALAATERLNKADSVALADVLAAVGGTGAVSLSDGVVILDAIAKQTGASVSDLVGLSDIKSVLVQRVLLDSLQIGDLINTSLAGAVQRILRYKAGMFSAKPDIFKRKPDPADAMPTEVTKKLTN